MGEFYFYLLLGHLAGDYLFQTNEQALGKKVSFKLCADHCTVYTIIVFFMTMQFVPSEFLVLWFLSIFVSHWIFDRYNLIDWWLHIIGSRSWRGALEYIQKEKDPVSQHCMIIYTAIVQTVADNTCHLILMAFFYKLITI